MIYVRPDARPFFPTEKRVSDFTDIPCKVVRRFKNRHTGRFVRRGRAFYIKVHAPAGWWPIADDLLRLRAPQIGARSEWLALDAMCRHGIAAPPLVAYGEEGRTPASKRSFVITEEIAPAISLEDLASRRDNLAPLLRRRLVASLADIARALHTNGINHRDFYLCHFLLTSPSGETSMDDERFQLFLIDLHRAQQRARTPRRWIVKDLAGLLFSAMDVRLSARDLALFMRRYCRTSARSAMRDNYDLWRAVVRRADRLYRKCHRRAPSLSLPVMKDVSD